MPVPLAAKAGIIAVSVVAAAAIAIYESPELQRFTNDLRRRIAIALHAFGDTITPEERENLFNRPEDAEGFLQSRGLGPGSVPGVEADAESLRRQREELMFWNAVRESRRQAKEDEKRSTTQRSRASTGAASSFDDFLKQDESAEKGTYIYQTGRHEPEGLIRRRRTEGSRGVGMMNYSVYTNPFADEHGIDDDIAFENSLMEPGRDEMASDIYSATDLGAYQQKHQDQPQPPSRTLSPEPVAPLVEILAVPEQPEITNNTVSTPHQPPPTSQLSTEPELGADEYMTAGQDDRGSNADAYSSIQAWAQHASHDASFYSPLPESPAPASEAELLSNGELTPTDSASLAGSGSGVDVGDEIAHSEYDVLSEDGDGIHTPTSWTDVESAAGESEAEAVHAM